MNQQSISTSPYQPSKFVYQLATSRGYVDMHNHFSTAPDMTGLLGPIREKAVREGLRVIGAIDFNNFGNGSRYIQLKNQLVDVEALDYKNAFYIPRDDLLILKGQEVPTKEGHLLVLGLREKDELKPGRSLLDTLKEAKDVNGITVIDHPFSPHGGLGSFIMKHQDYLYELDAWEIYNAEAALWRGVNEKAKEEYENTLSKKYKIGALSGSDGHSLYEIGRSATRLELPTFAVLKDTEELTNSLRKAIKGTHALDQSRIHRTRSSKIGALDHIADLAFNSALQKVRLRK